MHKAARFCSSTDILKLLLEFGANPNCYDDEQNTPLHYAAIRGTKDVAQYLLSIGANPYAININTMVPWEIVTKLAVQSAF